MEEQLAGNYSPEQIAGRARLEGVACVSAARIYQHVWQEKKKGGASANCTCAPRASEARARRAEAFWSGG